MSVETKILNAVTEMRDRAKKGTCCESERLYIATSDFLFPNGYPLLILKAMAILIEFDKLNVTAAELHALIVILSQKSGYSISEIKDRLEFHREYESAHGNRETVDYSAF